MTVLAMLYGTGLRRGELERLNVESFDRREGTLRIDGGHRLHPLLEPLRNTEVIRLERFFMIPRLASAFARLTRP